MPAKLSVNVNKVATLRNSRGGHVPSVIESPKATIVPSAVGEFTSIAFSHQSDVVVVSKPALPSVPLTSPLPSDDRYEVTTAPVCWLGRTFAAGM